MHIRQDIFGVKARLYGDLLYSSWPQISAGVQHKRLHDDAVATSVGAADDTGTDFYVAASKVWLNGPFNRYFLFNATARLTKANELGLLGFGGDDNDDYELQLEASAAIFIRQNLAVGVEYRQKPDNLSAIKQDDWVNVWAALFINKHFSITAAWLDFEDSNMTRFRDKFSEHLCQLSGGPCNYSGDTMLQIHQGMNINEAQFNKVVELMIDAMDEANVAIGPRNRLLALLAPARPDIIYQ